MAVRLHLDGQGTLLGTMRTRISLTLDDSVNAWSGRFTFDAMDPAGKVFRSDTGTLQATRISVEPV